VATAHSQGDLTPFLPLQELHPAAGAAPEEGSSHRAGVRDPALPLDLPQIQSGAALHAGHGLPLHLQVGTGPAPPSSRAVALSRSHFCPCVPWGCGAAGSEDTLASSPCPRELPALPSLSLPPLPAGTTCGREAMPQLTMPSGGRPPCRTAWRGSQTSSLTL